MSKIQTNKIIHNLYTEYSACVNFPHFSHLKVVWGTANSAHMGLPTFWPYDSHNMGHIIFCPCVLTVNYFPHWIPMWVFAYSTILDCSFFPHMEYNIFCPYKVWGTSLHGLAHLCPILDP